MLRLAADENFNGDIVRGLLRRNPKLDIVRVQDVGLSGADDLSVLQWAADQGRILVTHDISTLAKHAFDRTAAGQPMPGVFEVRSVAPVGQAIEDLILVAECSFDGEWEGRCASCPSEIPRRFPIALICGSPLRAARVQFLTPRFALQSPKKYWSLRRDIFHFWRLWEFRKRRARERHSHRPSSS
jgi:Domain of unknown function (DUF5615)